MDYTNITIYINLSLYSNFPHKAQKSGMPYSLASWPYLPFLYLPFPFNNLGCFKVGKIVILPDFIDKIHYLRYCRAVAYQKTSCLKGFFRAFQGFPWLRQVQSHQIDVFLVNAIVDILIFYLGI